MLTDKIKYGDAGYAADELFQNADYETDRQCMIVQDMVGRKILSREQALEAYGIDQNTYTRFLTREYAKSLKSSIISVNDTASYIVFVDVMRNIMLTTFDQASGKTWERVIKNLESFSQDIKNEKVKL